MDHFNQMREAEACAVDRSLPLTRRLTVRKLTNYERKTLDWNAKQKIPVKFGASVEENVRVRVCVNGFAV